MAKIYKTAMGKALDMDRLKMSNEDSIAVGNMKTNARGDQLGPGGRVVQNRNQVMDQHYRMHSPMAADNAQQNMDHNLAAGADVVQGQALAPANVDPSGENFDPPQVPTPPRMRGSLADSIAREVTVTQDLVLPPARTKGPSRI